MSAAERPETGNEEETKGGLDWRLMLTLGALLAAGAFCIVFILGFAESERSRELRRWQDKLALIAEGRTQAVESWLATQRDEIGELARNTSVQLLLTDLRLANNDLAQVPDAEGQLDYVRNLFLVAGGRSGFLSDPEGPEVGANLDRRAAAGLALLDSAEKVQLTTPSFQPPRLPAAAREAAGPVLLPLRLDDNGRAILQLAAPVAPIQDEVGGSDAPVGYVIGQKPVLRPLRELLRQPGRNERSLEVLLLQQEGAGLSYVLPSTPEEAPLSRSLALDTPESAAAYAYMQPHGFAERQDRHDTAVLVTGRRVEGAPWVVMVKVARAEALGPSENRIQMLLALLFLALALVAAVIAFVWRHGASRRARAAARRYRETAEALDAQRNLLRLVTDNQPTAIFTLDHENRYRFANRKTAEAAGLAEEDLQGKTLEAVLGPAAAAGYAEANAQARRHGEIVTRSVEWEDAEGPCCKLVSHVPISPGAAAEMLIVEYDISETVRQRRQQERTQNELIMTLIGVVDRRDPYAADHSRRVAQLADLLAGEMQLSGIEIETARIAGSLMNLGKILVPEELLTKEGSLTAEELATVRRAQQMSGELLQGISFRGEVSRTLQQVQEHVDGSGEPEGLKGEEILPTARILAVANAFVGMVSPRSYRAGLEIDAAIDELLRQSGKHYDQRVIAALLNYLENKGGREAWGAEDAA